MNRTDKANTKIAARGDAAGNNNRAIRLRVRFARQGPAAALSHLEQIKAIRSIACNSGLPCLLSDFGKSKVVKMSFGPAVSVGYQSTAEYADVYLSAVVTEQEAVEKLNKACGGGFSVIGAKRIPLHFPSLESLVNAAEYEVRGDFGGGSSRMPLEDFLRRDKILIRKTKPTGVEELIDAKPLIIAMKLNSPDCLYLFLRFGPKRNLKPERIINAWLSPDGSDNAPALQPDKWTVLRKQLYWESSSGRLTTP